MLYNSFLLPVVIRAERIAAGDHVGWKDLRYAAAPDTCGHAIGVPDRILKSNFLVSSAFSEIGQFEGQLAKMSTPGAGISGYNIKEKKSELQIFQDVFNLLFQRKETFNKSGIAVFGPLDEKEATTGARVSFNS